MYFLFMLNDLSSLCVSLGRVPHVTDGVRFSAVNSGVIQIISFEKEGHACVCYRSSSLQALVLSPALFPQSAFRNLTHGHACSFSPSCQRIASRGRVPLGTRERVHSTTLFYTSGATVSMNLLDLKIKFWSLVLCVMSYAWHDETVSRSEILTSYSWL